MVLDRLDLTICHDRQGIESRGSVLVWAALGIYNRGFGSVSFVAVLLQVPDVAPVAALGIVTAVPILEPILRPGWRSILVTWRI